MIDRRGFLKSAGALLSGPVLLANTIAGDKPGGDVKKPNIVFIVTDQ